MKKTPLINIFNAGELGHDEDVQVDKQHYYSGCKVVENMVPTNKGPIRRMPGTTFVKECEGIGGWPPPLDLYFTTPTHLVNVYDLEVFANWVPYTYLTNRAPCYYNGDIYHSSYYATTGLGYIVKFDVNALDYVGTISGLAGKSSQLVVSAIDPINEFVYFANRATGAASIIYKVRLSDFSLIGTLVLSQDYPCSMAIDSTGTFLYVAVDAGAAPLKIIKINLATFTEVGTLSTTLNAVLWARHVSYIDSSYLYFATYTGSGRVVKIKLSDFTQDSVLVFLAAETDIRAMIIYAGFMYCGCWTTPNAFLVKVDMNTFTKISTLTLAGIPFMSCGVQKWGKAVFACSPGGNTTLVLVDLASFTLEDSNSAGSAYSNNWTGAIDPNA